MKKYQMFAMFLFFVIFSGPTYAEEYCPDYIKVATFVSDSNPALQRSLKTEVCAAVVAGVLATLQMHEKKLMEEFIKEGQINESILALLLDTKWNITIYDAVLSDLYNREK